MSESIPDPQPNESAEREILPEATAPPPASASFGFVACNADPELPAGAETLPGGNADDGLAALPPLARSRQRRRCRR